MFRNRLREERHEASSGLAGLDLLGRPRFGFGALCIFLYVGAEVAIGSLIVNYLQQSSVLGLQERSAGELIAFTGAARWWGGSSDRRSCASSTRARPRLRRGGRDRPDPAVDEHDRRAVRLQPARRGADELDHVPDHLQSRLASGSAAVPRTARASSTSRSSAGRWCRSPPARWPTSAAASPRPCCCRPSAMRSSPVRHLLPSQSGQGLWRGCRGGGDRDHLHHPFPVQPS
jgi:hypothetical protein